MLHLWHRHKHHIHHHIKKHHKKYLLGSVSGGVIAHLVIAKIALIKLALFKFALFGIGGVGIFGVTQGGTLATESHICIGYEDTECDSHFADISTAFRTIESDSELAKGAIEKFDMHQALLDMMGRSCPENVIKGSQIASQQFVQNIQKKYEKNSSYQQLDTIAQLYRQLSQANSRLKTSQSATMCKQKFILHNIQSELQKQYMQLLTEHGLAGEKLLRNTLNEQSTEVLLPALDSQLTSVQKKLKSSEMPSDFAVNNITLHELGTEHTQLLKSKIIEVSETTIKKVLSDMLSQDILSTTDIQMLANNINIKYVRGCQATHGSYTISRASDGNKVIDAKFKDLTINVNLCPSYQYLHDLSYYVESIFVHELGHHIYYFKDTHTQEFEKICRNSKGTSTCEKNEFVSDYAQTRFEEDYAESFLTRYKASPYDKNNTILKNKINYFATLLK